MRISSLWTIHSHSDSMGSRQIPARGRDWGGLQVLLIAALLLPFLSLGSGASPDGRRPRAGDGPEIGKHPSRRLAQMKLRTLDGRQFHLEAMRGQVVVLNFFAIWCGYCRKLVGKLRQYGEREQKQGLQILGLAVRDRDSSPQRVEEFVQRHTIPYPIGMVSDPLFARFVDSRDVSVPQTLIYGRNGQLIAHFQGYDETVVDQLTTVIDAELSKE